MALLASELERIRFELGFADLTVGAEPYIGVAAIFDQVIQPYLRAGATTTSTTAVTAATTPTPVAITLASATGFAAFATVVIDVGDRQEVVAVQSLSGAAMTVSLSKAHSGTYPVTVEGGESMVRYLLDKCRKASEAIADAMTAAGIKQLDKGDVVFFGGRDGKTALDVAKEAQTYWRSELCRLLFGTGDLRSLARRSSGGRVEIY